MRTLRGRAFEDAGPEALAGHLEQAEVRDMADLDAGAVMAQRVLDAALHGTVVALLLHVDEVNDDEAGEIAQLELAGNLIRSFEVRAERGLLDGELACGLARVDVDRNQRLGLVDHEVTTRAQRHVRAEHRIELALDLEAREERLRLAIVDDAVGVPRHEHAEEAVRLLVRLVAGDQHLVDVLGI